MKKIYSKLGLCLWAILISVFSVVGFTSCSEEEPLSPPAELGVDPLTLSFDSNSGYQDVTINTNRIWSIVVPEPSDGSDKWLTVSKDHGENTTSVRFTVLSNPSDDRNLVVKIIAGLEYYELYVKQTGSKPSSVIYTDNMGATSSNNPAVTSFSGWDKTGYGSAGVSYDGSDKATVRTSQTSSSAYTGASGGNNIHFGNPAPQNFTIKDIDISDAANLKLSFAVYKQQSVKINDVETDLGPFATSDLEVTVSTDGTNWKPVTYNRSATADKWELVNTVLPEEVSGTTLSIKFTATIPSSIRIDDVKLTAGEYTPPTAPVVRVADATKVVDTRATLNGSWTSYGEGDVTAIGFRYKKSADGDEVPWSDVAVAVSQTGGLFAADVTGLTASTEYKFKSYVTKGGNTFESDELTFTTLAPAAPAQQLSENFSAATGELDGYNYWTVIENAAATTDKTATIGSQGGEKYVYFNAYGGTALASTGYETWAVSPPLDMATANKNVKFKIAANYLAATSSLEVYILSGNTKADLASAVKLTAGVNVPSVGGWAFDYSEVDLSSYTGTRYIAFKYTAKTGAAGYEFTDFMFGYPATPTVSPASVTGVAAAGVTGSIVSVTAAAGQAWTASVAEEDAWITLSTASGTGAGNIVYNVSANTGIARSGKITLSSPNCFDVEIPVAQLAAADAGAAFKFAWDVLTGGDDGGNLANGGPDSWAVTTNDAGATLTIGDLTKTGFKAVTTGKVWGGQVGAVLGADLPADPSLYGTFTVSVASGKKMSLSSLVWGYRASNTGARLTDLQYSLDGGATYIKLETFTASGTNATPMTCDLSAVEALQELPSTTTVTFRLVPYSASSATGTWYIGSSTGDTACVGLEVTGTYK